MTAERMSGGQNIAEERLNFFEGVKIGYWSPFKKVITELPQNIPKAELHQIHQALIWERRAHKGQTRRSGEPYYIHPLRAAYIHLYCAKYVDPNMSAEDVAFIAKVTLMHDVFEDSTATIGHRLKRESFEHWESRAIDKMSVKFPRDVPLGIQSVSEPIVDGIVIFTKEEAKIVRNRRLLEAPSPIQLSKGDDRLDNLRDYVPAPYKDPEEKLRETEEVILPMLENAAKEKKYAAYAGFLIEQITYAISDIRKDIREHPEKYPSKKPVL